MTHDDQHQAAISLIALQLAELTNRYFDLGVSDQVLKSHSVAAVKIMIEGIEQCRVSQVSGAMRESSTAVYRVTRQ